MMFRTVLLLLAFVVSTETVSAVPALPPIADDYTSAFRTKLVVSALEIQVPTLIEVPIFSELGERT